MTVLLLFGLRAWIGNRAASPKAQGKSAPAAASGVPASKPAAPADPFAPEKMVETGDRVIFGSSRPKLDPNRGVQIGRGQCPACHTLLEEQPTNRFPRLLGVVARAGERVKEESYQKAMKKYAEAGEPETGIKPHAQTAGEYIIESIYCPSCYVIPGFVSIGETPADVSPMPVINRPEVGLTDYEMASIVAYLQATDAGGDLSKVTAKEDWERYFGKKLTADDFHGEQAAVQDLSRIGLTQETPEQIIQKMGCYLCHKVPTVASAQTGTIGPILTLKTTAPKRLASAEYQQALKEGKARAKTPKEYAMESILTPGVYIAPGFDDSMPKEFKARMTLGAIERLAEFLVTLDEESGKKPAPADANGPQKPHE
jgi:cytochrome c2